MTKIKEEFINNCYSHNQDTKKANNDVNIETKEITKIPVTNDDISPKDIENCYNSICEISYIKENIYSSTDKETSLSPKTDIIKYDENGAYEEYTDNQESSHCNVEMLSSTNQEFNSQGTDSSYIDFDIILNTEYDLKDTKNSNINDSNYATAKILQSCEIIEFSSPQNNYIVVHPLVPIQTNQSIVVLEPLLEHENTTFLKRFVSKLTNIFKKVKALKIFSREFWFIWNLIALIPLIFITNKIIFSQMCLISTLYKNEMKNYMFVFTSIIVMLFSRDDEISIDNYDKFFADAELRTENVFNTTKKKVYYLSEWDYSHLPENPITKKEEISPIMKELQTKFETFDFLKSQNITINGSIKRSVLFQVKKKVGSTDSKIINLETDKFINNNIKLGVEETARLLPVIIIVKKHIYVFYMGKSIKINREMNLNKHLMFIFYPNSLVLYLERIALSQVPIYRNSIYRYINVHLLNECDLYFLNI